MVFRVSITRYSPPEFAINRQPVSHNVLCHRLREHLDANGYVDIEAGVRDILPDTELVNRLRDLQASPQIVPPVEVMEAPQVTNVVQMTKVALPNSIEVWHGLANTEFRPEQLIDDHVRLANDPYVKITRVWFPWNRTPTAPLVVHINLYGQCISSFRMLDQPMELNLHNVPANAPIVFEIDGVQQEVCMEFVYEVQDPPMRPGRNKTAFIRHRHSAIGGTINTVGEQLVAVTVHADGHPPAELELIVDQRAVPLYRAGNDLEYCASIVRDSTVIGDGPATSYVQLSHPIPFSVTTKAIMDITSQNTSSAERQTLLNSLS